MPDHTKLTNTYIVYVLKLNLPEEIKNKNQDPANNKPEAATKQTSKR